MPTSPPEENLGIDSLSSSGEGVGRLADGRVIFVPFTAPGDRVRVRLEEDHGRWLRGRLVSVEEPGPDRCEPVCPVFKICGGCTIQHIQYEAQLDAKRKILTDALSRIGRLAVSDEWVIHPSPQPYGYRGRTRVRVESGTVGYRRPNSHEICAVESCPVLTSPVNSALGTFADRCRTAHSEGTPLFPGDWEIAAGSRGAPRVWSLEEDRGAPSSEEESTIVELGEERIRVSPGVFTQSNALLIEFLGATVAGAASKSGSAYCLEIFAGAGFLTIPLARSFDQLLAIESHVPAIEDLEFNLRAAGLENVRTIAASAEAVLGELDVPEDAVVVVDPPRRGLTSQVSEGLMALAPRRIVYLSCDPATLARDLRRFADSGFVLKQLEGFDLFPQTAHLEVLAVIEPTTPNGS